MTEADYFDDNGKANRIAQKSLEDLEEIRSDYQSTFSTPAGERTLLSLYDFCKQMRTTFRVSAADPMGRESAYLEGRRSVILKILEHLHMDDVEIINRARNLALKGRL